MSTCAQQRTNMVESQIRPSDVTDRRIIRAMQEVPREAFVPTAYATLAYMDNAIPLGDANPSANGVAMASARQMYAPRTLAKLLQLAAIEPHHRVLDVGAGRGYSASILSFLAAQVVALECDEALAALGRVRLSDRANVTWHTGGLDKGAAELGPFDVIVLEGGVFAPPNVFHDQLKAQGRIVGVVFDGVVGHAAVWLKQATGLGETRGFEASITPLPGFEPSFGFRF